MKNVVIGKWIYYKPNSEYLFETKMTETTYKSIVESIGFWFKVSGSFIEMSVRVMTIDKPYPFEVTYVLSYEEAKEYFNNFEIFLVNNFEREEVSK